MAMYTVTLYHYNYVDVYIHVCRIPYNGKFLLVRSFAELLPTALEETFAVLIFVPSPCGDKYIPSSTDQQFHGSYFCGVQPVSCKILHRAKNSAIRYLKSY
jgi:hypothetical protein